MNIMKLEQIQKKFKELESLYESGMDWNHQLGNFYKADGVNGQRWMNSVQSLLKCIAGNNSDHYKNFKIIYDGRAKILSKYDMDQMRGILKSAMNDYESGFIYSLESKISGKVLSDLVASAEQIIENDDPNGEPEGRKNVAAVLASAALEDSLKRYAELNGIQTKNNMRSTIKNLMKHELLDDLESNHLDALVNVRNSALHADWGEISKQNVLEVIFRTKLVLAKFESI